MKKNYLFLLFIVACISLEAQITITYSDHAPTVGSGYTYQRISNAFFDQYSDLIGISGFDSEWDLSAIAGDAIPLNYLSPSSGIDFGSFPDASVLETNLEDPLGFESYYSFENGNYYIEGNYAEDIVRVTYSDKREFMKFPMSYLDIYEETFAGTVENLAAGQNFPRSGTILMEADAYGDLVLPFGTIDNVLRVRIVSDYEDYFMGTSIFEYYETQLLWYDLETHHFVASYNLLTVDGDTRTEIISHISETDYLSITDIAAHDQLEVYPNPVKEGFYLKGYKPNSAYQLVSVSGIVVDEGNVDFNSSRISVENLATGVYFIRATTANGIEQRKILVE